jgi:hypothetical protein
VQRFGGDLPNGGWAVFVRKALPQIDRIVPGREGRHHREDCRALPGKNRISIPSNHAYFQNARAQNDRVGKLTKLGAGSNQSLFA